MRFDLKDYLGIAIVLVAVALLVLHEQGGHGHAQDEPSSGGAVVDVPAGEP